MDKKLFCYRCPFCEGSAHSAVATGQVDHRKACGKLFRVKNGKVAPKEFVYTCPFCAGQVSSKVSSGRIDHREACGKQFYVKDGAVCAGTRQYQHKCPLCQTTVWSSQRAGRIQVKHRTPAGWPCAQHSWKAR